MIEKLIYTNEFGQSIELSTVSPFHVNIPKDVSGLSGVKNQIFSSSTAGQDGDTFVGQRILARDIDIVGYINECDKNEVQRLRQLLVRILNPNYNAALTYQMGDYKRVISCRVNSSPSFSPSPLLTKLTIQLDCLNPFWRDVTETRQEVAKWDGLFEFPEPEGLAIDEGEGMEFDTRDPNLIVNVQNHGDVDAGMTVVFRAFGAIINPSLTNAETQEFIRLFVAMNGGDMIKISTGYGQKRAIIRQNGEETDAFRYLDEDSTFFPLRVGDNYLRHDCDGNLDNLDVSVTHSDLYLGV